MNQVKVIIPIYKERLSQNEIRSLRNNTEVLRNHPIVLLVPEGFSFEEFEKEAFPLAVPCEVMRVCDEWLGVKNGIAGYNRMMLSEEFYARFSDCEYILICHTDAWIFRDELAAWCAKGYDCIGGIWWRRGVWALPLIRRLFPPNRVLYHRIGNGGLSLRRVAAFRDYCARARKRIDYYLSRNHHIYNEDVFWAVEPSGFSYPKREEANDFSFDNHPDRCMLLAEGRLPFGCHGWTKAARIDFWRRYIPQN